MKITLQAPGASHAIQSYGPGQIVIDQQTYTRSLILTPEQLIDGWRPQTADALEASDFEPLLALEPNIVLLGTGERQVFLPLALYASLLERGIGLEIMDTAAACRTFNILMSEGRQVAAALMMI